MTTQLPSLDHRELTLERKLGEIKNIYISVNNNAKNTFKFT